MTAAPATDTLTVPWEEWLQRWDAQQEVYIEDRERVFEVMFSFVEALLPPAIRVLDLAAGPGAISQRLLRRFPQARCVAVDTDPVLLRLGQEALGDQDGRLRWIRADFRDRDWTDALGDEPFDAVLSTTATHWLAPSELADLYKRLAGLLRPGGIVLNGDGMYLPASQPRIQAAFETVDLDRQARALSGGREAWKPWWDALRAEPDLSDAFVERDRIFPPGSRSDANAPTFAFHDVALREAGFEEVATVWQDLHKRILLGLR